MDTNKLKEKATEKMFKIFLSNCQNQTQAESYSSYLLNYIESKYTKEEILINFLKSVSDKEKELISKKSIELKSKSADVMEYIDFILALMEKTK